MTPLAKYALTLLPIALSIEELATSPRLRCHAMSVLVRTILVILSLLVALYIPYFGKYYTYHYLLLSPLCEYFLFSLVSFLVEKENRTQDENFLVILN